jgi:serpin B
MTTSHGFGVGLFIVGICLIISCSGSESGTMTYEGKPFPETVPDEVRDVANASNEFSFDLFSRLKEKPGNVFFSPASILTAVSMAQAGAEKSTLAEIQTVLHALPDEEKWYTGAGGLSQLVNAQGDGYELRLANRLWGLRNYSFRAGYLKRMEQSFAAPFGLVDFKNKPEPSRKAINDWVSDYTDNRIRDLRPKGEFDVNTRLVLVNAIYFQADWLKPFPEHATLIQPFTLSANKQVKVELMKATNDVRYFEDANAQILSLPYKSDELSMVVVLPKDTLGLGKVEQILTNQKLNDWIHRMATKEVEVYLPKFKTTFKISLNETLSEMGMPRAFSDEAEFGRMSSKDDLKISNAMHWAFVEVHEKGTKAVATTRIGETSKLAEIGPPEIVFRADHPFLFFIRHNLSGAILFFGRLADPR